jgi:superfamily II DNA or RNA helicase
MSDEYQKFIAGKLAIDPPTGITGIEVESDALFPHQRALSQWALRRGRCAVFANLGLGKTRVGLTFADRVVRHTNKPVLILTPLSVAKQMKAEAERMGMDATIVRESGDVDQRGINIINYERLHKVDPSVFAGVVPDESSCIKGLGSKTLEQLKAAFGNTPFRCALTATPAPNSYEELGQHCELLSICSRIEMLAEYFVHDGGDTASWRLKGYGRRKFWQFVASWGALVRSPADLGFDASAYELPPVHYHNHVIQASDEVVRDAGTLFAEPARTLSQRRNAKKASISERVGMCSDLVNASDEPWLVFCELNDESRALARSIRGAVELTGSMPLEAKEEAMDAFLSGEARVMVSKPSLCGHGVNMQHCRNLAFSSVSDSWEMRHQAIGRIHRFGQTKECHVHSFLSELEMNVLANLERKAREANEMAEELSRECSEHVRSNVLGQSRRVNEYVPREVALPEWLVGA